MKVTDWEALYLYSTYLKMNLHLQMYYIDVQHLNPLIKMLVLEIGINWSDKQKIRTDLSSDLSSSCFQLHL